VTGRAVRAIDDGAAGNGFTGTAALVNPIAWVNTVTLTTHQLGGADAENDDAYQDRLRSEIQAAGPPVTDADFAIKAIDTPGVGVGRATAQTTAARRSRRGDRHQRAARSPPNDKTRSAPTSPASARSTSSSPSRTPTTTTSRSPTVPPADRVRRRDRPGRTSTRRCARS
jgi:hypothetical protein